MQHSKRIVTVTGASGFVGRYVVQRLLEEQDIAVRCLVRGPAARRNLSGFGKAVSLREGDITRPDTLERAFQGSWGVINVAGYRDFWSADRNRFYEVNEQGALNVFKACLEAEVEKVVQVSTPLTWGVTGHSPFNEDSAVGNHTSDYARSKYLGDTTGWRLHWDRGLPLTTVYLAAVIGAGDDKATMEVRRAVEGKLPALVGADTMYTYLHVRDAAEAVVRALTREESLGRRYLIGNQRATTREYFKLIGRLSGVKIPARNIPEKWLMPVARGMEFLSRKTGKRPVLPLDILKTTAAGSLLFDASRSVDELGMSYLSLESALAESVQEIRLSA